MPDLSVCNTAPDRSPVERVADAVLYEGYLLYPYRPSSVKNRQRWTFGGVYPRAYSLAQPGADAWEMRTECLALGGPKTTLRVRLRFLHLLERSPGELTPPLAAWPASGEPAFRPVEMLRVGDRTYPAWQEAVERDILLETSLAELLDQPRRHPFSLAAGRTLEPVSTSDGKIGGVLVRRQEGIEGEVELTACPAGEGLVLLGVCVRNLTPLAEADRDNRDAALLRTLVSTHAIIQAQRGSFISMTDPPEPYRAAAAQCRNVGAWPVLAGEAGATDTLLCAPIILPDYPQVAPESPGDLFDATEIDEILTLRILTLTDEEKRELCAADERARRMLERTEALAREQLLGLHGTVRTLRPLRAEGQV